MTKKPVLRGKQRGRNKFRVELFIESGYSWKFFSSEDKNPTVIEMMASLQEAIRMLGDFEESKHRQEELRFAVRRPTPAKREAQQARLRTRIKPPSGKHWRPE